MRNINIIIKNIKVIIFEIFRFFVEAFSLTIGKIWEKFQAVNFSEKIIFLGIIPAFFAIILPVARFFIFGNYFYVNNPFAVYMIGIVIIMPASVYLKPLIKMIVRIVINLYYLFWIIYIPMAGELTKARPYEFYFGYYLNIAVPAIFAIASFFTYYAYNE